MGPKVVQETISQLQAKQNQQRSLFPQLQSPLQHAASFQAPSQIQGSRHEGNQETVECARTVCAHAVAMYHSETYMTPFDAEHFRYSCCGKADDATAIVIHV